MRNRTALSRRRRGIYAAALLAGVLMLGDLAPARAVSLGNLSSLGSLGVVRVRPVERDRNGGMSLLHGDGLDRNDPNRTVGDTTAACVPGAPGTDCIRTLAVQAFAGARTITVNDGRLLLRGDTIQIGSPHCNYVVAGPRCFGEQSRGETAVVTGGAGLTGASTLTLAAPLAFTHEPGERVVKLPTAYQGQTLRVDIPNAALTRDGTYEVDVVADMTPPGYDATNPSHRRPLPTTASPPKAADFLVRATGVEGVTSFYITKELTGNATIGRTYDDTRPDTWYQVEVTASLKDTASVVSDGVVRFKLNPVTFAWLDCDGDALADARLCVSPDPAVPTQAVTARAKLVDASAPETTDRRVEAVIADVLFMRPDGSTKTSSSTSCYDTDPRAEVDNCGTLFPGAPPSRHGEFQAVLGGPQCVDTHIPMFKPPALPALPAIPSAKCVTQDAAASLLDTSQTGTYGVEMTLRGLIPAISVSGVFDVLVPTSI